MEDKKMTLRFDSCGLVYSNKKSLTLGLMLEKFDPTQGHTAEAKVKDGKLTVSATTEVDKVPQYYEETFEIGNVDIETELQKDKILVKIKTTQVKEVTERLNVSQK